MISKSPVLKLALLACGCVCAPLALQAKIAANDDIANAVEDPVEVIDVVTRDPVQPAKPRNAGPVDKSKSDKTVRLYGLGGVDALVQFERIEQGKLHFKFRGVAQSVALESVLGLRFNPYKTNRSGFGKHVLGMRGGELLHVDKYEIAGESLKFWRDAQAYEIELSQVVQLRPAYLEGEVLYSGPDQATFVEAPMPPGKQGGWFFKDGGFNSQGNGVLLAPMANHRNFLLRFKVRNLQEGGSNGVYVAFGCKKPEMDVSQRKNFDPNAKLEQRFRSDGNQEYFAFDRLPASFGSCAAVQFDHNMARLMAIRFDAEGIPMFEDYSFARYDYGAQVLRRAGECNEYEMRFNQQLGVLECYINGYRSLYLMHDDVKNIEFAGNMGALFKSNDPSAELRVEQVLLASWQPESQKQRQLRQQADGVVYAKDGKEFYGKISLSAQGIALQTTEGEQKFAFDSLKGFEIRRQPADSSPAGCLLLLESGERLSVQQLHAEGEKLVLRSSWGESRLDARQVISLGSRLPESELLLKTINKKNNGNERSHL